MIIYMTNDKNKINRIEVEVVCILERHTTISICISIELVIMTHIVR